jgi:CRP-like cAMP-binding protein
MSSRARELPDARELLAELIAQQRTTNDLLRAMAIPTLTETLRSLLRKEVERKAFEASDGTRTTRAVADAAGSSPATISRWWTAWRNAGVAVDAPDGHVRHLIPLSALGIKIEDES